MKKLRKNASMQSIVKHARALAEKRRQIWLRHQEYANQNILTFEERCRLESAWEHYSDLDTIASQLERLNEKSG